MEGGGSGGARVREIEEMAARLAEAIAKLGSGEERVAAALAAVTAILERGGLTLMEQAALLKMVEVVFAWGAKEVCDRLRPPLGVV